MDPGLPRPERRGQDHHGGDAGGVPPAYWRRGPGAGNRSGLRRARLARPGRGRTPGIGPEAWLTEGECVSMYAGYYPRPLPVGRALELVGLTSKAGDRCDRLSGGQLRRLDMALALIGDPELGFLDEPTTGFDPSARHTAWEVSSGLRARGRPLFLTCTYLAGARA